MKLTLMTIGAVLTFGVASAQTDSTYTTTKTVTKKRSEHVIQRKSDTRDTVNDIKTNTRILESDSLNRSPDPVPRKEKRIRKTKTKKVKETITQ